MVQAPQSAAGTTEFTVRLVSLEGAVLAEVKSSMIVAASYVIGQRSVTAEQSPQIVQPPMPAVPPAAAPGTTGAAAKRPPAMAAPAVVPPPAPPAAAPPGTRPPQLSAEDRARLERFVTLGNRQVATGNIAAARQFFRKAAEEGLAEGALLLATMYDPVELSALGVQGLAPDPAEARRWYERARALGAAGADARLARLGSR